MQVRKWGDGLAVVLPEDLVQGLGIEEGDELEIETDSGRLRILRGTSRQAALDTLKSLAVEPPAGFRFSRSEAYERGGG